MRKGEFERREHALLEAARAVDADKALTEEMLDWEVAVGDGVVEAMKVMDWGSR